MAGVLTVSNLDEDVQILENPKGHEKSPNLAGNNSRLLEAQEPLVSTTCYADPIWSPGTR